MKKLLCINIALLSIIFISFYFYKQNSNTDKTIRKIPIHSKNIIDNRKQVTTQTDDIFKSTVLINSTKHIDNFGSGYVVGEHTIVTNKHVVENLKDHPEEVIVRVGHKDQFGHVNFVDFLVKKIILPRTDHDVAILIISDIGIKNTKGTDKLMKNLNTAQETVSGITTILNPVKFDNTLRIKQGDIIDIVGYPGDKKYGTLWHSTGKIDMIDGSLISFKTITQPGNSGSPIFNSSGHLIGMNVAGNTERSFGFLIDKDIKTFIDTNTH